MYKGLWRRRVLVSSGHSKVASVAGTQWPEDGKEVREGGRSHITQGFVSYDKEFGTFVNCNQTSLECFKQEHNMDKFVLLKMTVTEACRCRMDVGGF